VTFIAKCDDNYVFDINGETRVKCFAGGICLKSQEAHLGVELSGQGQFKVTEKPILYGSQTVSERVMKAFSS